MDMNLYVICFTGEMRVFRRERRSQASKESEIVHAHRECSLATKQNNWKELRKSPDPEGVDIDTNPRFVLSGRTKRVA